MNILGRIRIRNLERVCYFYEGEVPVPVSSTILGLYYLDTFSHKPTVPNRVTAHLFNIFRTKNLFQDLTSPILYVYMHAVTRYFLTLI